MPRMVVSGFEIEALSKLEWTWISDFHMLSGALWRQKGNMALDCSLAMMELMDVLVAVFNLLLHLRKF